MKIHPQFDVPAPVEQAFRVSEPGSRPDTVFLTGLPADWFGIPFKPRKDDYAGKQAPFRKAMARFGPLARIHIETRKRKGTPFMYHKPVSSVRKPGSANSKPRKGHVRTDVDTDEAGKHQEEDFGEDACILFDAWVQFATYEVCIR